MAMQHYTGSLINILLDSVPNLEPSLRIPVNISQPQPTSYAKVLKTGLRSKQVHPAQPEFVRSDQTTGPNMWRIQHGQNRQRGAPGMEKYNHNNLFTVPTSNMFSQLSSTPQGN